MCRSNSSSRQTRNDQFKFDAGQLNFGSNWFRVVARSKPQFGPESRNDLQLKNFLLSERLQMRPICDCSLLGAPGRSRLDCEVSDSRPSLIVSLQFRLAFWPNAPDQWPVEFGRTDWPRNGAHTSELNQQTIISTSTSNRSTELARETDRLWFVVLFTFRQQLRVECKRRRLHSTLIRSVRGRRNTNNKSRATTTMADLLCRQEVPFRQVFPFESFEIKFLFLRETSVMKLNPTEWHWWD